MTVYYNEFDPFAAQMLRNLIAAGHIAPGFVDERSIENVKPWELFGYTQCHFFAGVGVWSLALRRAGWPDDRHVWTASCPCQSFSSAGQGAGFNDKRHLWPAFYHLVGQLEPTVLLGEQVASKDADAWIDLVHADMEAMDYAFGCVPFPAAGVGAPNLRERAYWVAYANRHGGDARIAGSAREAPLVPAVDWPRESVAGELGGAMRVVFDGLADTADQRQHRGRAGKTCDGRDATRVQLERLCDASQEPAAGPVNGLWRDADWLHCRDGKWRPVEPGTFPLVNGAAARVGRLRAYGNALNAEAARIFIESVNEVIYETN